MKPAKPNIVHILKGCKKDKRTSQKELYKMFYSYSLSICMRYANSRDDAVEIMNDGFLNVFTNMKKYDFSLPFKPWLRRILINSAINHFNKYKKFRNQVDLEEASFEKTESDQLDGITYDEMIEVIRKLPPAYRTVFNLHAIEGYRHEDIANMLDISIGTSKSNYAKARKKLKIVLDKFFEMNDA